MKIYWGLRPSPKKVQERIEALERELGIDDKSVLAEVEQNRLERNRKRGPVILNPKPLQQLHANLNDLDLAPGMKWPVENADSVQFLTTSSYSGFHQVIPAPKSRVVLPAGVRV